MRTHYICVKVVRCYCGVAIYDRVLLTKHLLMSKLRIKYIAVGPYDAFGPNS